MALILVGLAIMLVRVPTPFGEPEVWTLTGFRMISLQDAQDSAQSLREALDGAGLSDAVEIRKTVDENGMVRFAIDLAPGRKDRMEAILRHLGDEGAICHDLSLARALPSAQRRVLLRLAGGKPGLISDGAHGARDGTSWSLSHTAGILALQHGG